MHITRIDNEGNPFDDSWETEAWHRKHDWKRVVLLQEEGIPPEWSRVLIECRICHQVRKVWKGARLEDSTIANGCPRVPWLYRLRNNPIPTWDNNSTPPWLRKNKPQPKDSE